MIRARGFSSAFSLLEMFAVMAVMAILTALTVAGFRNIAASAGIGGSARQVADLISLARQTAIARSIPVEVRFYLLPGYQKPSDAPATVYRAAQLYVDDAVSPRALGRPLFLDTPVVLSDQADWNSFLSLTLKEGEFNGYANAKFVSFRFKPNGISDLDPSQPWFLTVYSSAEAAGPRGVPRNFAVITVEPVTGNAAVFQP